MSSVSSEFINGLPIPNSVSTTLEDNIIATTYKLKDNNNKEYPLCIKVYKKVTAKKNFYYYYVFFPNDYPDTEFRKYSKSFHEDKVAQVSLFYNNLENYLMLMTFYVYSNFDIIQNDITEGEKLKGFGNYILCKAIEDIRHSNLKIGLETNIEIYVSGDQCYKNITDIINKRLELTDAQLYLATRKIKIIKLFNLINDFPMELVTFVKHNEDLNNILKYMHGIILTGNWKNEITDTDKVNLVEICKKIILTNFEKGKPANEDEPINENEHINEENIGSQTEYEYTEENVYSDDEEEDIKKDEPIKKVNIYDIEPEPDIDPDIEKNDEIFNLFKNFVCKLMTNQELIKKNYEGIYKFRLIDNMGIYANMTGTVKQIMDTCTTSTTLNKYLKYQYKNLLLLNN